MRLRVIVRAEWLIVTPVDARGGLRVLHFVDEGRAIVCTDALRQPKARQLPWLVRRSRTVRASYLAAQKAGALRIVED